MQNYSCAFSIILEAEFLWPIDNVVRGILNEVKVEVED